MYLYLCHRSCIIVLVCLFAFLCDSSPARACVCVCVLTYVFLHIFCAGLVVCLSVSFYLRFLIVSYIVTLFVGFCVLCLFFVCFYVSASAPLSVLSVCFQMLACFFVC